MRPVLLDMAGFGSFRDPTTVDFRDVDYFVLVGPTGSGKSTVIDAMTFALYGTVPRWDDRRAVSLALAPTVSRGTVRLIFDVGGERYVAARELRRAASGLVGVKNARLERLAEPSALGGQGDGTEVLAADSGVTPAVEKLLGLPYEHFTTCVVLPQGDFAEFLHERPAKRQEILVRLLGLDVYQRICQAANSEASAKRQRADYLAEQLTGLADATVEAERAAHRQVAVIRRLAAEVGDAVPALAAAATRLAAEEQAAARLRADCAVLRALTVPAGLGELDDRQQATAAALRQATQEADAAEDEDAAAREALTSAPARGPLEQARNDWAELADVQARLPAAQAEHQQRTLALTRIQRQGDDADAHVQRAREALEAAQRADLAATLRPHLLPGDPCPVCEQPVVTLPEPAAAADIAAADRAMRKADREVERLRKEWRKAARAAEQAESTVAAFTAGIETLQARLCAAPDPATVAAQLADRDRLEEACRAADRRLRAARAEVRTAQQAAGAIGRQAAAAWAALDTARDPLVALGAPALARDDLAGGWTTLAAWAADAAAEREKALPDADRAVGTARGVLEQATQTLAASLAEHGIVPHRGRPLVEAAEAAVAVSLERARNHLAHVKERRAQAADLDSQRRAAEEGQQVARTLGQLLRADGFQRWLLGAALDVLVAEASRTLAELSGGQFELGHIGGEFLVVDHFDADSRRPVKTLSGGETFQASLALALALSTQLAGMAAAGAARLDSIFLDEGFGTLDEATLEVVAATLESLATHGDRMVGVVTHVPGLAERVPVRFAVRRDQRTSSLAREAI